LTTGELYEKWKNNIVDDNVQKAAQLDKNSLKSGEISGKQPETTFDNQKSANIHL